jgi:hypothetical protein
VFSTCLFCHASLGANDAIEHFPVGKRLAFDGERGRLWAVCLRCARWNLAPIEERWEALEECEKAYRAATKRVSTDNIALARLKDGTDLVRIGQPLLPESAAWRYTHTFLRRARWATVRRFTPVIAVNAVLTATVSATLGASAIGFMMLPAANAGSLFAFAGFMRWRMRQPTALLFTYDGALHGVTPRVVGATRITYDAEQGLGLRLQTRIVRPAHALARSVGIRVQADAQHQPGELLLMGEQAHALLPQLLPALNQFEASGLLIDEAIARVERQRAAPGVDDPVVALLAPRIAGYRRSLFGTGESMGLLSPVSRLAAEMALHEDDERRALAGELGALYARWEKAERTAAIADTMVFPSRHSESP